MKHCSRCGKEGEFGKDSSRRDGLHPYCKSCLKDYKPRRELKLVKKYGISLDQYDAIFAKQEGKCAICNRHQSEFKRALAVDHSHETSKVRGLLCFACNSGIGKLQDNPDLLDSAARYLRHL
jgi:hypothetical protein